MPNIEYVLASVFHIDKGPSLVQLYPAEIPGLSKLPFFAELMIPDQIHKRLEDYTLFLLHRNFSSGEFEYKYNPTESEAETYFVYTIVNNVEDAAVRRGSVIKALSIVTRLLYFKHFKPLLLIAMDSYINSNDLRVLCDLYEAINGKNFSINLQKMSVIKRLLLTSILDLPLNKKIYQDETFRNKLLGITAPNPDLFIRKDLSYNSVVSFNNMEIPVKVPILLLPDTIGDYLNPTDLNFKSNLINLIRASLATFHHNSEITVYGAATPPIMVLINAMLTGKRILFVSYDNSAGYIIDHVLVMLKLITGGGILTDILTNYNVFPLVDVSKVDLLASCDSFLAGTINPLFKGNDALWDVLYDLDANEMHISSRLAETEIPKCSIIAEDAHFLSSLQLSLFNYNDDLTTIQFIIRRHINQLVRVLLSQRNFVSSLPEHKQYKLLMDGVGYYWFANSTKVQEMVCYQSVITKFQELLFAGKFNYTLMLPRISNELNLIIDLQHHLQKIYTATLVPQGGSRVNEREIWFNILRYLSSGKSVETFMLLTYLIPPQTSSSLSSSLHSGNITIFDRNKGMELVALSLFHEDERVKSSVLMILEKVQEKFLCSWCFKSFMESNLMYRLAYEELSRRPL